MGDKNLLMDRWVPEGDTEMKPTQRLIAKTYLMLVSRSQVISPELAELLGTPCSTPEIEATARHSMINAYLNAPRIAEVFALGGRPLFKEVRESAVLYNDLCRYLLAFKQAYENDVIRLGENDKMMTNVLKLENLAEWVHGIALPYFKPEDMVSANSLAGRIGKGRFTRGLFAKKAVEAPARNPDVVIVTHGVDPSGPTHGRVTDTVMEQQFVARQKRTTGQPRGWN